MMNNKNQNQEKPITEHSESSPASNTRRKLVKGSAIAFPVVMTLRSGSALAASSSNRCIAQNQLFAEDRFAANELLEFSDNQTNNVETFLREAVTSSQLIRIIRDPGNMFWIYDKNADNTLNRISIYNYSQSLDSSQWLDTALTQTNYLPPTQPPLTIDIYDSATTGPGSANPVITAGQHFVEGNLQYVLDDSQTGTRYGLIMTTASGEIRMDRFGNPRIGLVVDNNTLISMHLTTSCLTSLAPTP